jgi:hypothetical protein
MFGKVKPPAREKTPSSPPGERVEIALALDADARERAFRAVRRSLPPGHWTRVTIDGRSVTVQGLRRGDVEPVRHVLDRLAAELARPVRRRELVA